MRVYWRVTGFIVGVLVILAGTPSVSFAQPLSISSKITVSGVVPPRVFLIVGKSGEIERIFSNSSQDGEPMAMLGSIEGRATPMTDRLAAQYQLLRPSLKFSYGYIYTKPVAASISSDAPDQKSKIDFFSGAITSNIKLAASRLLGK